ncbi:hypothetical protein [Glaciimonas sp. PAMC28666]|uniref:hypothetical protein n=1 Tax=Glaciimonas sp. PAMC28666 TaxID=2807626 RepID=UPI0019653EA1|nr:hypothetical protein [Glaciimonas sp. PAMC28666]QRX82022.1 hypothetical protein JQN73_18140 [Glaciimonas sp. PAMC28666]
MGVTTERYSDCTVKKCKGETGQQTGHADRTALVVQLNPDAIIVATGGRRAAPHPQAQMTTPAMRRLSLLFSPHRF